VLLAALATELVLFQRRQLAIAPEQLKASWAGLVCALLGGA